jgi:hypothetical protein
VPLTFVDVYSEPFEDADVLLSYSLRRRSIMSERFNEKPTIIQTSSNSGVWGAVIIVALLIAGGAMYYVSNNNNADGSDTLNVTIDAPKVDVPAAPAAPVEAPAAAPAPTPPAVAPAAPVTNQ